MSIAAFDFYEFGEFIHKNFKISPTDPINTNFESLGFESSYFLINMGSMFLFYIYYMLCVLIKLCLQPFATKKNKLTKKVYLKLRNTIIWGSLITLINETYIFIVLSVLINMKIISFGSEGLIAMSSLCIFFLVMALVVPSIFIGKLCCSFKHLE